MGRPRENAGQRSSGQNAVPSIGESQDGALRGKKRGGRPRRASQPQNVPSRTKVARNEQGAYVPVLWDQGPAVVAEEADTQHGLGKAYVTTSPSTPSNSCDSVLWISGSNRSTTRDTSDISEDIFAVSSPTIVQTTPLLDEFSLDELETSGPPLWLSSDECDRMLSTMNDMSMPSLDNNFTESPSWPEVTQPRANAARAAESPVQGRLGTSTVPGVVPARFPIAEAPRPHDRVPPCSGDQYENWLYQLSRLHLDLYRLLTSSSENASQHRESDRSFVSGHSPSSTVPGARIDETFAATQTLIEILQHLFPTSSPTESPSSTSNPPFELMEDLMAEKIPPSPDHSPDTATILLILTCYLRLLQIYEPFVVSLHQRLQQSTGYLSPQRLSPSPSVSVLRNGGSGPDTSLPAFSLGSFSLAASADLNIELLLHLVSQMLERIHGAVRVCLPSESSGGAFSAGASGESAFRTLRTRSDGRRMEKRPLWRNNGSSMTLVTEAALNEVSAKERVLMGVLQKTKGILGAS